MLFENRNKFHQHLKPIQLKRRNTEFINTGSRVSKIKIRKPDSLDFLTEKLD